MKIFLPLAAGLCFAMLSCNQSPENRKDETTKDTIEMADSTNVYRNGSSAAAIQNNADTLHKFIRTADLKFKVKNVEKTVYIIEDIVSSHGGFVTLSQLNSNKENELTTPVSEDSAIETTSYIVTNTMTVRVPNTKLDTTLKDIARLVGYLDYRIIKADDIGLQVRANSLQQKRAVQHVARLTNAIDKQGKKLNDITTAEETLQDGNATADEALLSNLSLSDQVNFSTVQLSLYQPGTVKTEVVAVAKEVKAYEPNFDKKVMNALQNGIEIGEILFIGLLQIWPLLLLIGVGFWLYKKYKPAHPGFVQHKSNS